MGIVNTVLPKNELLRKLKSNVFHKLLVLTYISKYIIDFQRRRIAFKNNLPEAYKGILTVKKRFVRYQENSKKP